MQSYSPLTTAIIEDKENDVKILLEKKVSINAVEEDGNTPLMYAAAFQRLNIIRMLLESKADINQINNIEDRMLQLTALSAAIKGGDDTNVFKLLLDSKANIHTESTPILNMAAIYDRSKIATMLVEEYKVDINATDLQENTALMNAAIMGSLATVEALLKFKNIDIDHKNILGKTAHDRAVDAGNYRVLEVLIGFRKKQSKIHTARKKTPVDFEEEAKKIIDVDGDLMIGDNSTGVVKVTKNQLTMDSGFASTHSGSITGVKGKVVVGAGSVFRAGVVSTMFSSNARPRSNDRVEPTPSAQIKKPGL